MNKCVKGLIWLIIVAANTQTYFLFFLILDMCEMEPVFKVCKLYSVFWYKISYATLTVFATGFNK